jgi:hypothetical protein
MSLLQELVQPYGLPNLHLLHATLYLPLQVSRTAINRMTVDELHALEL